MGIIHSLYGYDTSIPYIGIIHLLIFFQNRHMDLVIKDLTFFKRWNLNLLNYSKIIKFQKYQIQKEEN